METYYKFSVLAQASNGESLAIVSGDWFGVKEPTPIQVRNQIKVAIAPWFETPDGIAATARYHEFDLGDLYLNYYPPIERLLARAGIINLSFQVFEGTSNWKFTDSLLTEKR